jgi:branched-chain amino acid aminotransferase
MQYYFLNGQLIDAQAPALPLNDLGLFRGYGIFDFLRTQGGKPLLAEAYVRRFLHSAEALGLKLPYSQPALLEIIDSLLERNGLAESGIRLLCTGGASADMFSPAEKSLLAIRIEPLKMPPAHYYSQGVKLISCEFRRELPQVKHTNYLNAIRLWPGVQAAGAVELLYHAGGEWLECSRSNLFMVKEQVLITPPADRVLAGITRQEILALARKLGIKVEERRIDYKELWQADEVFISGTTKRVLPVVQLDEHSFPDRQPGPVSQQLLQTWKEEVERIPLRT